MAQPSPTFYVFHGSDEFAISEAVADFRGRLAPAEVADLNTVWIEGRGITIGELRHACEAIPFMADKRLVIVDGLLARLDKGRDGDFTAELLNVLQALPETSRLVFVERGTLSGNHPVLKLAKEHERGYVRQFEPPADSGLSTWIEKRVAKHGGSIAANAAAYLAQVVGGDMRLLDQEVIKLVTYAGDDAEIALADVRRLVPYVQQAVIFDLVDALGQRNGRVAASTLQRLVEGGEHPLGILAMIVRQFRLMIQVKELGQAGENTSSAAKTLGTHPFVTRKLYQQAANFTANQLEHIYRHLLTTDSRIKRGEIQPEVALDLLVAGLSSA